MSKRIVNSWERDPIGGEKIKLILDDNGKPEYKIVNSWERDPIGGEKIKKIVSIKGDNDETIYTKKYYTSNLTIDEINHRIKCRNITLWLIFLLLILATILTCFLGPIILGGIINLLI